MKDIKNREDLLQFLSERHPDNVAHLNWQNELEGNGNVWAFGYISSYKDGADYLVDIAIDGTKDILVFTILFSYRHYLELILKHIYLLQDEQGYKTNLQKISHNLDKLFEKVKPLIENKHKKDYIDLLSETVAYFDTIDRNSYNFRYVSDKKNNQSISPDFKAVNLVNLKKLMDTIDDGLYGYYA